MSRNEDTLRETREKQKGEGSVPTSASLDTLSFGVSNLIFILGGFIFNQKNKKTVCCSNSHEICTLFRILELSKTRELRKMGPVPKEKSATQLLKNPGR